MKKPLDDKKKERLAETMVNPRTPLREAVARLYQASSGILLLCNEGGVLLGTLTDGDIRRAILKGAAFDLPCETVANRSPITAPEGVDREKALELMTHSRRVALNQLPLVDGQGRVKGLLLRSDLIETTEESPLTAIIMAGGYGTRLRPLTEDLPKPMLPVGDRPLLELTLARLRVAGIKKAAITTHYLPEKIMDHFGDGSGFGVELSYIHEERPLGTAGALGLMDPPDGPALVINGDILTEVDFSAMLDFHLEHQAEMSVAVRQYVFQVPYGVLECDGQKVCGLKEKPEYEFMVNAGMYILEPSVWELMPKKSRFNMTDLIEMMMDGDRTVVSFPVLEYWLDVGQPGDYRRAQDDLKNGEIRL